MIFMTLYGVWMQNSIQHRTAVFMGGAAEPKLRKHARKLVTLHPPVSVFVFSSIPSPFPSILSFFFFFFSLNKQELLLSTLHYFLSSSSSSFHSAFSLSSLIFLPDKQASYECASWLHALSPSMLLLGNFYEFSSHFAISV